VQAIVWLADMADFEEMNAVYDAWIDSANPPARAAGESKLAAPGYKVEIIVTAVK
jgi:enamine deaminase RidA (YjgF/YER057c/UK114 family)